MPEKNRKGRRRIEVFTGLLLILVAFSYVASLLLDFKFVSPYATLQEDLVYLSEHTQTQMISSYAWLATAVITLIAIPFYFIVFRKSLKVLPYLNGLFMIGASAGFLMMARMGMDLQQDMEVILGEGFEQAGDQVKLSLLDQFRQEQFYRRLGSSCVGLFAIGLSLTRLRHRRFPLLSMVLLLVSGPALIFFNWYDPDHLARTGAMAGIIVGVVVFSVRLINKGLSVH
jgi:hypothetical protein